MKLPIHILPFDKLKLIGNNNVKCQEKWNIDYFDIMALYNSFKYSYYLNIHLFWTLFLKSLLTGVLFTITLFATLFEFYKLLQFKLNVFNKTKSETELEMNNLNQTNRMKDEKGLIF